MLRSTLYIHKTVEHGWSRNVLALQIESRLHDREGQAVTNFAETLPAPQSDLARQTIKDPYIFDFLSLGPEATEREVEQVDASSGTVICPVCYEKLVREQVDVR